MLTILAEFGRHHITAAHQRGTQLQRIAASAWVLASECVGLRSTIFPPKTGPDTIPAQWTPTTNSRRRPPRKRRAAIKRAQAEYRATLAQIDALQSRLDVEPKRVHLKTKQRKTTPELIADMMPRQRQFTFAEIHKTLCEAEPDRAFNQLSIRTTLRNMAAQGILKSVGRNQQGRACWAAVGSVVEPTPHATETLHEMAEAMLRAHGPMTPTELVVALKETGYRPDASPRQLIATLRTAVRRHPERFTIADGRWSVV